jgi:glycosyltransferase involved in cell wall biosynthesis
MRFLVIHHATQKETSSGIVLKRLAEQHGCTEFLLAGPGGPGVDFPLRLIKPGLRELGYRGLGEAIRGARPDVIFDISELSSFTLWQAHWFRPPKAKIYAYAFDNLCLTPAEEQRLKPGLGQAVRSRIKQLAISRNRRIVDLLLVASQKAIRAHADKWHVPEDRMKLAWFPVLNRQEMLRDTPDADLQALDTRLKGKIVLGYCGRFVPEKGLDLLARLAKRLSPGGHLLLVGEGPLASLFDGLPNVTILPFQKPMSIGHFYQRMSALILPSRTVFNWEEQFGRVIHEAKMFGIPVLASRSGSIPEYLEPQCLFAEDDLDGLIQALRPLFPALINDASRA